MKLPTKYLREDQIINYEENDTTLAPIRLPKSLLNAARRKAARNDEKLSQVVRKALRAYVEEAPKKLDCFATETTFVFRETSQEAVNVFDPDWRTVTKSGTPPVAAMPFGASF